MPSRSTRKYRRYRGGANQQSEPGAYPFEGGMGAPSEMSLRDGQVFQAAHVNQHGGASDASDSSGVSIFSLNNPLTLKGGKRASGMASGMASGFMKGGLAPGAMPMPGAMQTAIASGSGAMPRMTGGVAPINEPNTFLPADFLSFKRTGGRRRSNGSGSGSALGLMRGGVAPLNEPTMQLPSDMYQAAKVSGNLASYGEIKGMQDGGRRRRRGSRKGRKGRKSRKGRKGLKSRRCRTHRHRHRRYRGGAAPLNGDVDISSSYGPATGPGMLLGGYSGAGLNPDWADYMGKA